MRILMSRAIWQGSRHIDGDKMMIPLDRCLHCGLEFMETEDS